MDTEHLQRPATEVTALAESARDLLELAFGPRGALANIRWLKMSLGEQRMSLHPNLYAVDGEIVISFILPHVPIPPDSTDDDGDESRDIPF